MRPLREDRRHGSPDFPFATYEMIRPAGDPILDNHWHEEAEFLWVTGGSAVFQIGLNEYVLRQGEAMFVPGGEIHGGHSLGGGACAYRAVVFGTDWLAESGDAVGARYMKPLQRGEAAIPSVYAADEPWAEQTVRRLEKLYELRESRDPSMAFRVKAELMLLFADLLTAGKWTEQAPAASHTLAAEQMKAVVAYIESEYAEALSVADLARVAGMSPGHFSRVFKSYLRKTPMEYVLQHRLSRAALLLRNGSLSVGQIAMEVGLPNFSYFGKAFKTKFGVVPSGYRKKLRSL